MRWTGILGLAVMLAVAAVHPANARSVPGLSVGGGDSAGLLHLPPDDDQPAPIVIMLSDGPMPDFRDDRYIEHLIWSGIAVLEPQAERPDIPALIAAASWVIGVDANRIALLARGAGSRIETGPIRAAVLLYPGCGTALPRPRASEILLVHGSADAANQRAECSAVAEAWRVAGLRVQHEVLEGVGYAWDNRPMGPDFRVSFQQPGGTERITAVPLPDATEVVAQQAARFLARALGVTP